MARLPSLQNKPRERARCSGATPLRLCLIMLLLRAAVAVAAGGPGEKARGVAVAAEDPWTKPRKDARAKLMGAKKLIEQGRFAEAHPLIEQARRVYPLAPVLLFLADLYQRMDERPREATVLAELKIAEPDPERPLDKEKYSDAAKRLADLERELASVQVSGADRVQVDDGPEQRTIRRIYVEPGPRRLRFPGGASVVVTLSAGQWKTVAAPSQDDPPPPPPPPAGARLRTAGWVLTSVGLAGLVTGGILLAVNGQECDKMPMQIVCPNLPLDTFVPGLAFSVSGGAITVAGVVLLGVGYRRRAR